MSPRHVVGAGRQVASARCSTVRSTAVRWSGTGVRKLSRAGPRNSGSARPPSGSRSPLPSCASSARRVCPSEAARCRCFLVPPLKQRQRKKQRQREASEWITLPAPELRIVDEELWQRVKERLDRAQGLYARSQAGK